MKLVKIINLISTATLLFTTCVLADSKYPDPGCFASFSDLESKVAQEGIVVSYVSPADGRDYSFDYGVFRGVTGWTAMCAISLPSPLPENIKVTITIPNEGQVLAIDSANFVLSTTNSAVRLMQSNTSQMVGDASVLTLNIKDFGSSLNGQKKQEGILELPMVDRKKSTSQFSVASVFAVFTLP